MRLPPSGTQLPGYVDTRRAFPGQDFRVLSRKSTWTTEGGPSASKRSIYELAQQHDFMIVEDGAA